jgi:dihydrofolate synthase/folylpolyglutamate synthase
MARAIVAGTDQSGEYRPTFFEITTTLAFQIFATERVDYAVVETGLGGLPTVVAGSSHLLVTLSNVTLSNVTTAQ